jgi:hypothetical protein
MLHIIQMGSKKTGLEMLAEALRDIAILVAVFNPLDVYVASQPNDPEVTMSVMAGCVLILALGIFLEKIRGRDDPAT